MSVGDSVVKDSPMVQFLQRLQDLLKVERPFTLILDDPCGNSHLQNLCVVVVWRRVRALLSSSGALQLCA